MYLHTTLDSGHTAYFIAELSHAHHDAQVVLDGEAQHVLGAETSVLIHLLEKLWVLVGVLDVDKLAGLRHQASYPLPHLDRNGVLT